MELPPDYYLINFNRLVKIVTEHYADLISDDESNFINQYNELSEDGKRMFVRLCMRTKSCYYLEELNYQEIRSIKGAIAELNNIGFILINPLMDGIDLLNTLTKENLKLLFSERGIKGSLRKELMVENISSLYTLEEIHHFIFNKKTLIVKNKDDLVEVFLHFFFGNRYQDLTEFVLLDLGMVKYENYPIDKNSRLFSNRFDFDCSLLLSILSEESYLAVEADRMDAILDIIKRIPSISNNRKLISQKGKILNRCAAYFEKNKLLEEALSLYQQTERAPSRERQARIFNALKRKEDAIWVCEKILIDFYSEDEKEFAESFIQKIQANKNKAKIDKTIPTDILALQNNEEKSVELIALEYLQASYHQVFFVENTLINSLFGLWFWEEIFTPIQGAFCHPFQFGPLDLYTEDFYQARKENLINKHSALNGELKMIKEKFLKTFHAKYGIANHFVFWEILSLELLDLVFSCIPMNHLSIIFKRMLLGLKENSSGFPDLIAFSKDIKTYELIEIKGPGDKLQKNQTRWFHYFMQYEIPCRLVHVKWK